MANASLETALRSSLTDVDRVIQSIVDEARNAEIDPYQMRNTDGSWSLASLLLAKSNLLLGLSNLKK